MNTDDGATSAPTDDTGSGIPATDPGQIVTTTELLTTSLGELGQILPCSRKAYSFHRPNMGTMKRLGQLQADRKLQARPGQFVALYLAAALSELGGEDMGPVKRSPKLAEKIQALPAGDVLTLLIAWTHRQHSRKGVELGGGGCGACGALWESLRVNLADLTVHHLGEDADPPMARVGLWEGFPVHGKEVQTVILQAPTWGGSLGRLAEKAWGNPTAIRASTLQGSIAACDAFPRLGRLGSESLDELMPDDLELLDEALGKITPTIDLSLEVECPACGVENVTALDWKSLGFSGGPARA